MDTFCRRTGCKNEEYIFIMTCLGVVGPSLATFCSEVIRPGNVWLHCCFTNLVSTQRFSVKFQF